MGKVGGVCVLQAGEVGIGCGLGERRISDWERAREQRERVLEWASVSGACWTVHCRRSEAGVWFVLRKFCGNRKKLCSSGSYDLFFLNLS